MDLEQPFVIRPANLGDLEWFYSIAHLVGTGFTSLPNDKDYIQKRITIVEKSFKEEIPIEQRVYLFVRENLPERKIVGICGIDVDIGYKESFYNYQISTVTQSSTELNKYMVHTILNIVNNFQDASELITFWVHPEYRGKSISKSLSLSRFLFMARFAEWFNKEIIAEVRGIVDANGVSPFWEAVGKKFFGMDFVQADAFTMLKGKQFIADLASREPIYVDLLDERAQRTIGSEHPDARPARHLLERQGFKFNNHVDIFDAGPLLSAERDKIKAIVESRIAVVANFVPTMTQGIIAIIYNNRLDVRMTVAYIEITSEMEVTIAEAVAKILEIKVGDQIRYYNL